MSWIITGTQKNNWTPADIDTALWLDAADASTITESGGAVSQWDDKSGNDRDFSQASLTARPSYSATGFNAKPSLTFNSTTSQCLERVPFNEVIDGNAFSVFFVGSGSVRSGAIAGVPRFYVDPNAISYNVNNFASWPLNTSNRQVNWMFDGIDSHTVRINGSIVSSATQAVASGFPTTYFVGRAGNSYSNGVFSEYLFIQGSVSVSDNQKIEGYLAHKWGLTADLPVDHPYKTAVPVP